MPNQILYRWTSGTVIFLLSLGMVHPQSARINQRVEAINKQCQADRQRLGLDQQKAEAKYPAPKITSCPLLRLAPGSTGEVVVRGTFQAGTTFLFDNDKIEVVKETLNPGTPESEYRATVKVAQGVSPGSAQLELFQPITCQSAFCYAVSITGKFEYSFTGDNGWRVNLKYAGEPVTHSAGSMYHAEFYRPNETSPFRTRDILLSCQNDKCGGGFALPADPRQAEVAKLQAKLTDPKLPMEERMKLTEQFVKLQQEVNKALTANASKSMQDNLKEANDFGCANIHFDVKGQSLAGGMCCGKNVGHSTGVCDGAVDLKGTVKSLEP
jgi:hypothetical protein